MGETSGSPDKRPSYLKEAFLYRTSVAGLGNMPVNILCLLGFLMLGFGLPGFWFLGLGCEIAYLYAASTNKRFQRWVNAKFASDSDEAFADEWKRLVSKLSYPQQQRLHSLEQKCERVIQQFQESKVEGYLVDNSEDALRQLAWVYLKLLIAENNLESLEKQTDENTLRRKVQELQKELEAPSVSDVERESKTATLRIHEKRLENLQTREQSLREIESDLNRIEAQVDLALENATMQGQPQAVSANIDLFSHALDGQFFGDQASAVANLDQKIRG
jgi:hypothetical protein